MPSDQGEIIDPNATLPYLVTVKVRESLERWMWQNCPLNTRQTQDRNDIPNWNLARRVVLGKDPRLGAMARSVNIYTQWTQSRIKPEDPTCRACQHPLHACTLKHRNFPNFAMCEESLKKVGKHLSVSVIEHLRSGFGGELLAKHALLLSSCTPAIPNGVDQEPKWINENLFPWERDEQSNDGRLK